MGKPAEHHMRQGFKLPCHRLADMRVVVSMCRRPPGCDTVDKLTPVRHDEAAALRACNGGGQGSILHLGVGQPDMVEPFGQPDGVRISHARIQP